MKRACFFVFYSIYLALWHSHNSMFSQMGSSWHQQGGLVEFNRLPKNKNLQIPDYEINV